MELSGLTHQGTNEIVGQEVDGQFLANHRWGLGAQHIHVHRGFEMSQIQLYFPPQAIQPGDVFLSIGDRIQQRGDHGNLFGPIKLTYKHIYVNL